eukprot:345367-Amphidinium_carterae.4
MSQAFKVMTMDIMQPEGSTEHNLAIEVGDTIRIMQTKCKNNVMWYLDSMSREDPNSRKKHNPEKRTGIETSKFAGMAEKQDSVGQIEIVKRKVQWRPLFILS